MSLEGDIYRICSREAGQVTVCMLPESRIYAAHFPGHPVTPGAVLVRMAVELLGSPVSGAKEIRFLCPVQPEAQDLVFSYEPFGPDGWSVTIADSRTVYAKMRLTK